MNPISNKLWMSPYVSLERISPIQNEQQSREQIAPNMIGKAKSYVQSDVYAAYDEKTLKKTGIVECSTCAQRTYQDGSNDPGVSFKAPTHVDPSNSYSAVRGHEQEHVVREQANARESGGKVISQSVSIFTSICPECGRSYTSGGLTRTTTRYSGNSDSDCKGGMMDLSV